MEANTSSTAGTGTRGVSRRTAMRSVAAAAVGGSLAARVSASIAPSADVALRTATGPLRLGSNENPFGLGPQAKAAFQAATAEVNRYPYDAVGRLMSELAAHHEVDANAILLTPGSGQALWAATQAFTSPSRALIAAAPTFETPGRAAETAGCPVRAVPVDAGGALDLTAMAAQASNAGLCFVCNPNNPTGGACAADAVKEFITRVHRVSPDAIILVDEAYFEYVESASYATAVPLMRTDRRIIVTRTFSKVHGMAGLRVGYTLGHPDTLAAMQRRLGQGTITNVSAATALASLKDRAHLEQQVAMNREARAFTRDAFERAGFAVLPSQTNFVMVDVKRSVSAFRSACQGAGVQIARTFPPLTTHVRVSIGSLEQMRVATQTMLKLLEAPPSSASASHAPHPAPDDWSC